MNLSLYLWVLDPIGLDSVLVLVLLLLLCLCSAPPLFLSAAYESPACPEIPLFYHSHSQRLHACMVWVLMGFLFSVRQSTDTVVISRQAGQVGRQAVIN